MSETVKLHRGTRSGSWACQDAPFSIEKDHDGCYKLKGGAGAPVATLVESGFTDCAFRTLRDARQALATFLAFHWSDKPTVHRQARVVGAGDVIDGVTGVRLGRIWPDGRGGWWAKQDFRSNGPFSYGSRAGAINAVAGSWANWRRARGEDPHTA